MEGQKAFEAKDYMKAIELFEKLIELFPESIAYTLAIQRIGESCEGLLEAEYQRRMEQGEAEPLVRQEFLSKLGHLKCWEENSNGLVYNQVHYKTILEHYPDSPIADEAAYRLISWENDYKGLPNGPLRELKHLQEILESYPTTSLRSQILYQIAERCHILYEIYSFSPRSDIRDTGKAQQYKEKAALSYQLCLGSPKHTMYAEKSWTNLQRLEEGKRIYIFK
jgi:tetratricopeptide (TPR) repeat protein